MQLEKIPATIVTGFLGSGKTTLLSNVIKQAQGKRFAVIVNEFGELDIDADLLRSCPLECDETSQETTNATNGIYELANGCICCTVEEEFLPVMQELVNRRDDIDHILIETSGLALPKPLVQAFNWPDIKQHCTVDAVITMIDGPAVAAGRFANNEALVETQRLADPSLDHEPSLQELLDDQLSAADIVVVSKNDLLDDAQHNHVQQVVDNITSASVKTLYVNHGDVPLDVLIGVGAQTENHINDVHNHHDHHHDHGAHHEHAHDHFDSCVIALGEVDADHFKSLLQTVLNDYNIYRAKGILAIPGKPMRQVIQAVGTRIDTHFDRLWNNDEQRASHVVIIGKDFKEADLLEALRPSQVTVETV
jgi:cobalamin biosynthesis protein CobW